MDAKELRDISIKNYNGKPINEILDIIKKNAEYGKSSLTMNLPCGDTLCHILKEQVKGIECSATLFSDGWHVDIHW